MAAEAAEPAYGSMMKIEERDRAELARVASRKQDAIPDLSRASRRSRTQVCATCVDQPWPYCGIDGSWPSMSRHGGASRLVAVSSPPTAHHFVRHETPPFHARSRRWIASSAGCRPRCGLWVLSACELFLCARLKRPARVGIDRARRELSGDIRMASGGQGEAKERRSRSAEKGAVRRTDYSTTRVK